MAKRRHNNEGSIYQRLDGTWRAQVTIDGKRLSFSAKTQKECASWIRKTTEQIDAGLTYDGATTTLEKFTNGWLSNVEHSLKPKSIIQYRQITRDYIIPELGKVRLRELRPGQIQALYNRKLKEGVGVRTVQVIHAVLHNALNQAIQLGVISQNPCDLTKPPKPPQKEMQTYDEIQVQRLLIAAKNTDPYHYALYHLALVTGMRMSELLGIKWQDIDWENRKLKVQRQVGRKSGGKFEFVELKTLASRRIIKLGKGTLEILRNHRQLHLARTQKASDSWQESGVVFSSLVGKPIYQSTLLKRFKRLARQAGLPVIRFHDLRHTAASLMLNNNIPLIRVSRRLGHSKPSLTLDVYGHIMSSKDEEAAELMDDLTIPV